jgi:hypothetical protein
MMTRNLSSGANSNVTNLKTLNSAILGYGDTYNPANVQITPAALKAVYLLGQSAVNAVDSILPANTNAKNVRSKAFDSLGKLATRAGNAFKSLVADKAARVHIRSLILLIQRGRVNVIRSKSVVNETEDPSTIRENVSHKSGYEKQLDNFYKLIQYLSSFTAYKPNESDLTVEGLTAFYNKLAVDNQLVTDTQTQLDTIRRNREKILYHPVTGLVQLSIDSKSYIKSVFGASSPEYKQISKLKFGTYKNVM